MMKMPKVAMCEVHQCAYNAASVCHALAITVGDDEHPRCDTFFVAPRHGGDNAVVGQVGACKVDVCKFNTSFECSAPSIKVGLHQQGCADCKTFQRA